MKGELMLRSKTSPAIEAEECFRTATEIAREQGALFWELRIALSRAQLCAVEGRHDEVRRTLARVYDRFTEGFDAPDLRAARALLNGLSA
jgi:predicted ATPase